MSSLYPPPDFMLEDYCAVGDVTTTDSVIAFPVVTAVPIITTAVDTDVPVVTAVPIITFADVTDKVLPAIVPGGGSDFTKSGPSDDAVGSDTFRKVLEVTPGNSQQTE